MLNHLDKHFILYAKGHYQKIDENPLYDLAGIVTKACALPEGYTNPYKSYLTLSETFVKITEDYQKREFFKYLFSEFGSLEVKEADYNYAARIMLGQIANVTMREQVNGEWKDLYDIGEADPEIWPLSKKPKEIEK